MITALIDADIVGKTWIDSSGYVRHGKDLLVHRTVMQNFLGRELKYPECVHHINYNKQDNRIENLLLCANDAEHRKAHAIQDIINDGHNPEKHPYCTYHKRYEDKKCFSSRPSSWNGLHNICREGTNEYRKQKQYKSVWDWRRIMNQQFRRAQKKGVCSSLKEGRCL